MVLPASFGFEFLQSAGPLLKGIQNKMFEAGKIISSEMERIPHKKTLRSVPYVSNANEIRNGHRP